MMKKKMNKISGVTLIELLVGVAVTAIMMGAMFTSYTVVNNSYSQVTDKAAISTAGRDMLGMIIRDIRNAGFQYFGDTIRTTSKLSPILITKDTSYNSCDKIELVSGDVNITYPSPIMLGVTVSFKAASLNDGAVSPLPATGI